MNEEKITEYFIDISTKLGSIQQNLSDLSETILKHESRLTLLQQSFHKHLLEVANNNNSNNHSSFKNEIIKLLCKGILVGSVTIASLSGAGGVLKMIFGL